MLSDRDASRTVNAVPKNAVEISAKDGETVKLEFDEATGLPAREIYRESGMGGGPAEMEEVYSDWRDAGGLKLPFKITILKDGKKFAEAIVSEYKFNTGIKAEELSKKP